MDYDDIDYDEGYSIRDIDNNWLNSNMDYDETDSDFDSDIDDYNYNNSTNNWNTLTGDKINQQTDRHNNSLLEKINKKLELLETMERSITNTKVEMKNDSFLDILERMKALNSEREFQTYGACSIINIYFLSSSQHPSRFFYGQNLVTKEYLCVNLVLSISNVSIWCITY